MRDQIRILEPYSEVVGTLNESSFHEGVLIATVGRISITLPSDLADRIRSLIGQRVAILRTDIPNKQYLCRNLEEENACRSDTLAARGTN